MLLLAGQAKAQLIQSHNDYDRTVPLYEAYAAGADIFEIDLYLSGEDIKVCHDREDVASAPRVQDVYLEPLRALMGAGKPIDITLMIDIKDTEQTLEELLELIEESYGDLVSEGGVKLLVCGDLPEDYRDYPNYVKFDVRSAEHLSEEELERVGLISYSFRDFTKWNGKGAMSREEQREVQRTIDAAHAMGIPIRFWAAPDNVNTWVTLTNMGVDVINTDDVAACADFFRDYSTKKSYTLESAREVYTPTMKPMGGRRVKNVILLIGDGMSLTQITAAETANRGELSILNMPNASFIKTSSLNCYNTDSAGAGTALASGSKTDNRRIGMSYDSLKLQSISEALSAEGMRVGVVTTDGLVGATPSAFYGHAVERDNAEEIATGAHSGAVWLLAGGDRGPFESRLDGRNILEEAEAKGFSVVDSYRDIDGQRPTLCFDRELVEYASEDNMDFLAEATASAIAALENKDGFFLMVEASKIDNAGHANNVRTSVLETLLFDAAVAEALRYADSNGETLVIVTGDHETGGMVLLSGSRESGSITVEYTTNDHTGVLLPLFSYGPKAQQIFQGVYENSDLKGLILKALSK